MDAGGDRLGSRPGCMRWFACRRRDEHAILAAAALEGIALNVLRA
jgi:hypothetical protein